MNTDSFTDEQLLNLVNNTISQKTEFAPNDFTGGAVIITSTHRNTIKKFRISLYFGYNGKHSINRQIDISKDLYFIWAKAILVKILSLDVENVGMDVNELNKLMKKSTNNSSIVDSSIVDSKQYGDTPVPTTVPKSKFDIFREEAIKEFKRKKISTFSDKITATKKSKDAFNLFEVVPDNLPTRYAEYIYTNKGKGVRLDKWLVAVYERNEKDINYGEDAQKQNNYNAPEHGSLEWHRQKMIKDGKGETDAELL